MRLILGVALALALLVPGRARTASAAPPPPFWSAAFSPDGRVLAAGGYRRVVLWDVERRTPLRQLGGLAGPVRSLAWQPDGKQLAAGGGRAGELGEVRVWSGTDAHSVGTETPPLREHRDLVEALAFSASGDALLSAGADERVLVTGARSRQVVRALAAHTGRVQAVAFSPSGRYLATGSLDKTVKVWNAADYQPLVNLDRNGGQVYALAFLVGDQLAAAGEDGNVRIYRLAESRTGSTTGLTGTVSRTINGDRTPVLALAAARRGDLLVYGGEEKVVVGVDPRNGNRRWALKECGDAVYALAVSPDGTLVAAGSRDGKVRLWTAADGKVAGEF
jgi:WD40 repeat protein